MLSETLSCAMKYNFLRLILPLFLLLTINVKSQKVIGFIGDWHAWSGNSYFTTGLQYDYLTDVVLAFILPNADGSITVSSGSDYYNQLTKMRDELHARGKKIHISAGGWSASNTVEGARLNPDPVQEMVNNPEAQEKFVEKILNIVETYNLDGFNMDWEYPDPSDSYPLEELLYELRSGLDKVGRTLGKDIELTIAVSANSVFSSAYTSDALTDVDFIYVMAFDNQAANHSSLSFAESGLDYWMNSRNVEPSKLILGVPAYSRGTNAWWGAYKDFSNSDPELYFNDEDGMVGNHAYNSKPILKQKIDALNQRGCAGVFMWELWDDRIDEYSLLRVLYFNVVGFEEIKSELEKIEILPNPMSESLTVNIKSTFLNKKTLIYSITDITGKVSLAGNLNPISTQIDASNLKAAGLYFITISEGGNKVTYKLIKK